MVEKKKRKKKSKEKTEKEEKDEEELEEFLAKLKMRRAREPKRLPPRKTGGGRPAPKIFGFPHFSRYQSEPKPKLNPIPKLENYGRRTFGWSEPKRPKAERVIIRNEPDAEHLLKALEKNPKLYNKLSKKLLERMNDEFNKQLEANINDSEKNPEKDSFKYEIDWEERSKTMEDSFRYIKNQLMSSMLFKSEAERKEFLERAYEECLTWAPKKSLNPEFYKELEAEKKEDEIKDSEQLIKDEQRNLEASEKEVEEKLEPTTEQKVLSFEEFAEKYPLEFDGQEFLSEDTRQEIMRRAYENYLGNEVVNRLTEASKKIQKLKK